MVSIQNLRETLCHRNTNLAAPILHGGEIALFDTDFSGELFLGELLAQAHAGAGQASFYSFFAQIQSLGSL